MSGPAPKRLPPASIPAGIRWKLWRRAREHDARDALLRLLRALLDGGRASRPATDGTPLPRRVLLVRTGRAIGDMVMTLSLVAELRRLFPGVRVECVMRESLVPFFEGGAGLDAIHPLPRRAFLRPRAMVRLFRALRSGWDAAIACDTPLKSSLTALCLCHAARAARRIGFDNEEARPFLTDPVAAAGTAPMREDLLRLATPLLPSSSPPLASPPPLPHLAPTPSALGAARMILGKEKPPVLLFASGHWSKGWPVEAWARVASRLTAAGHRTWIAFGPGDPRGADPSVQAWMKESRGLGGVLAPQSPQVFVALLALCRGLVSNDCGPYHLAVAAGARCVGVFPTPEARRDFGYEQAGRLIAIHEPDPAAAERHAADAAMALFR